MDEKDKTPAQDNTTQRRTRELATEIAKLLGSTNLTGHVEIHYRKGVPTRIWSNRVEIEF